MWVVDVDSPVLNVWDTADELPKPEVGDVLIETWCECMGWGPWRVIAIVADLVLVRRPGKVRAVWGI